MIKLHTLPLGQIETDCYIGITENNRAFVVDPGDQPERVLGKLKSLGVGVAAILLTHGHFDHIGGVKVVHEKHPEAIIYIGAHELPIVKWSQHYLEEKGFSGVADYIAEHAVLVEDQQEIIVDTMPFTVMHTPGHTQGSVMYITGDDIFSGDTVFREEIGRCDLPTGDFNVMLKTLGSISKLAGDYTIYPGHGESTTLDHERAHNPYFKQANAE